MWKIKKSVLESIVQAAQNTHPNEFIALLGGNLKKQIVEEWVILPSIFGSHHASIRMDLLPYTACTVGSVHSHPGFTNKPSGADKHLFSKEGEIHLIICLPFSFQTIQAYSTKGTPLEFEVIS
ncbi:Mov34/MPN/PAD-1 family protein [Candidatus Micrarchaeota archaeon]|nr:Mov34/MPN/PAD-1 family protein [Candidatus Micrarchaeota archaeon]